MKKYILSFLLLVVQHLHSQTTPSPSFEQWLSLKQTGGAVISSSGKHILYTVTSTDWENNSYDTEVWLSREGKKPFQLTNTSKGSSSAAAFSPDEQWISFLSDRGNKTQLFVISIQGGEAYPVTKEDENVISYEWNPDGTRIAFTRADPESKSVKSGKERYGGFVVEGEDYKLNHLWVLDFNMDSVMNAGRLPCYTLKTDSATKKSKCNDLPKPIRITTGNYTVGSFGWSPDGKTIAFTKMPNPLINSSLHADIAVISLKENKIISAITNPSSDNFLRWGPDGTKLLYASSVDDSTTNYFKNNRIFIYSITGGNKEILAEIDENKNIADWNDKGIFFTAQDRTRNQLYIFDPAVGKTTVIQTGVDVPSSVSFSKDGSAMALTGRQFIGLNEVFAGLSSGHIAPITSLSEQLNGWVIPTNEVIQWKSKDGINIEGILLKPSNFNPAKKYPLLVVIHGGPTGTDRPEPTPSYVYPIMQWCEKGAVVLRVNYRGSAGYGEKFRALNVKNLGIGDMWDVMSGIDYLAKKGIIDTSKMGCMGWSQGGYISAFLTTNTDRFKAISVGAGISNWVTYYVNTDITPFTRQYLKGTPWSDKDVYSKTSPMSNINKASTPTLIQHGEFDKRVPIPNAYELYRGLQDRKIPSRLIIYKGFGHGINKPKERLAAVWHNWNWFNHYVFGDPEQELPNE